MTSIMYGTFSQDLQPSTLKSPVRIQDHIYSHKKTTVFRLLKL